MELLTHSERFAEVHLQAVLLHDAHVDGLSGVTYHSGWIAEEPLGRRRTDANSQIRARRFQGADNLMGTHRVAVAVAGNIIKN